MAIAPETLRRGDVVLVRLRGDKARPAVVVRSDLLEALAYATVLPITTDLREDASLRINIVPTPANGLRQPSQIMVDWLQTVRFSDMGGAIGMLDRGTMQAVTRQMAIVLGIGTSAARSRRPG